MATKRYKKLLKLMLIGGYGGVGKSSLMYRFTDGIKHDGSATASMDFRTKEIQLHRELITLQIWDTSGGERSRSLIENFLHDIDGFIVVYDVTRRGSFDDVRIYLRMVEQHCGKVNRILVGNKNDDLDRKGEKVVSTEEARKFADEMGMQLFETSARNNINVEEVFLAIVELALKDKKRSYGIDKSIEDLYKKFSIPHEVGENYNVQTGDILAVINKGFHGGFLDKSKRKSYHELVCIMALNLICPDEEWQYYTDMPLEAFTTVQAINSYINDLLKYGPSLESNRGVLYILGNTGVGKTSLVNTFTNFIKNPRQNPSFQTSQEKSLLETQVVQVYSGIQDSSIQHLKKMHKVKISPENYINIEEVKTESNINRNLNLTIYDHGGQTEYFSSSQLFLSSAGIFCVCFDSKGNLCVDSAGNIRKNEDIKKEYYSSVGTYIDLILQKAMKTSMQPKIVLVATKCGASSNEKIPWPFQGLSRRQTPSNELREAFKHVLELAKEQLSLVDSEASEVFLANEVFETTSCKSNAKSAMQELHSKIAAMLTCPELRTKTNLDIPISWFRFLTKLRTFKNPQMTIEEAEEEFKQISNEGEDNVKMSDKDCQILSQLKRDVVERITENALDVMRERRDIDTEKEKEKEDEGDIETNKDTTLEDKEKIDEMSLTDSFHDNQKVTPIQTKDNNESFVNNITSAQNVNNVLDVFSCLGEILSFKDVESLKNIIIPEPMALIKSLRSILNHDPIKRLGKNMDNHDFINELTCTGIMAYSDFTKMFHAQNLQEKSSFTDRQIFDILVSLDLACSLGSHEKNEMVMVPCLIQDKNKEAFDEYENKTIGEESSICIQYMFSNNAESLGIYGKVLRRFAQKYIFRDPESVLTRSYSQKIEERQLGSVGGIHGIIKHCQEFYNFMVVEYETDFSLDPESDSLAVCSFARHRCLRFYLNSRDESKLLRSHVEEILYQFDEIVQEVAEQLPFKKRLVCKTCLKDKKRQPGSFRMTDQTKLNIVWDCSQCSTPYKNPFKHAQENRGTSIQRTGAQIYIENMNVQSFFVQNLAIQNLTAKLGVTDEREASGLLMLLGAQEDAKQCEQKLTRLNQSEVDFGLLKISTMTRSTCLVDYSSPDGNSWHGTGFLLTVENFSGLIMLSAGHNFEDNGAILRDFKSFNFYFNNMSGQRSVKSKSWMPLLGASDEDKECITLNMKAIMEKYDTTLVITYKNMQLVQKGDSVKFRNDLSGNDALFDYFGLIFHDAGIQATMEKKGLRFLQSGSPAELSPNTGDPLLVFGHPGVNQCNCQKKKCSCSHPLRLSYGQETGSSTHRIEYDLDTLGGNSGSPITGKQCKVKGIHVSGNKTKNCNMAQTVQSVLEDLRKVTTFP